MPDKITFDDALSNPSSQVLKNANVPDKHAGKPITFDDALAVRQANTHTVVQTDRLKFAQELGDKFPEEFPGEVPIEPFMRTSAPEVKPADKAHFSASLKANIAQDPQTKRRVVAESIFPGDPNGPSRVGFIDDEPVYVDDSGQLRKVSNFASRKSAEFVAAIPEVAGSIAGSFATGNPVTGAALGGAGGRGVKRAVSELVFDEPATAGSVVGEMGAEGVTNLVGGGIGKGIAAVAGRGKVVNFTPENIKTATQARDYIKHSTGIDVDLAQASGNRKFIAIRAYAARFPGKSAEMIQAADDITNGQLDQGVSRVINLVAKATPAEVAGTNGVNAAQMAIKAARQKVYKDVGPLYDAAYNAVPEVSTATKQGEKILDYLKLPYFQEAFRAGQTLRALETGSAIKPRERTVENLIKRDAEAGTYESATTTVESTSTGAKRVVSKLASGEKRDTSDGIYTKRSETTHSDITRPSLAELDYTKRALDERIESLMEAGQRQRARALKIKRDEFVTALDQLPNQQWQLARKRYGELARDSIEPLEQGAVGVLAKIPNPKTATAAAKIFSDPNITAQEIRATHASIAQQDPEAWNGLVRQWVTQNWNKALKETQTGDAVNPAGKLRQALIGTPTDKAKAAAMMPPGAMQAFDDLMTAAQSLSRTPTAGSNTMRDTEIKDQLKGTGAVVFKWLTSPRQSIREAAEQKALENHTISIAEAILDPAKQKQLRQVVKMPDSTRKAIMLTSILGAQVAQQAVATEPDSLPRTPTR